MKQSLSEKIRMYGKEKLQELKDISAAAGIALGLGVLYTSAFCGVTYFLASNLERIRKATEWVANNPCETLLGATGAMAFGVGACKYIERKLHAAKTLDDFVERAKRSKKPVDVQFHYGRGLGSYKESIKIRAGKMRYDLAGECEAFGSAPENLVNFPPDSPLQSALQNEISNDNFRSIDRARGKATGLLSLIETTISLAEAIQKQGLMVTINMQAVQYTKDYLATCKEWVRKGYAFIAG